MLSNAQAFDCTSAFYTLPEPQADPKSSPEPGAKLVSEVNPELKPEPRSENNSELRPEASDPEPLNHSSNIWNRVERRKRWRVWSRR